MSIFDNIEEGKLKKRNNKMRGLVYYGVIIGLLIITFIGLQAHASSYKKEVKVVSLKKEIGNSIITDKNIKALSIAERSMNKDMILWKDREFVVNKYPTTPIRRDTPVYKDMVTDEQIVRYKYLYELKPNEEALTFKYNKDEAGGRIPQPGDRFRIRGSYEVEDDERISLTNEGVLGATGESETDKDIIKGKIRVKTVFDVATVHDMLNSDGESIYEIIEDTKSLTPEEQDKLRVNEEYKKRITSESLILIVESSQVEKYVELQANGRAVYTLTLLSRDKSLMDEDIKTGQSILDLEAMVNDTEK